MEPHSPFKAQLAKAKFTGDAVLVAVGRKPYTENLGLETVGIQKDPKGFIPIDASFRTSQPNIFAIGDLVEGPMLAHKASEEGIAVAELIAGHRPTIDYLAIPNVAYTSSRSRLRRPHRRRGESAKHHLQIGTIPL